MSRPLAGQTILVTRPARQAAGLVEPLEALGATVWVLPAIEIAPPDDLPFFDSALRGLDRFDWLVLTSVNGVEAVRERFDTLGLDQSVFAKLKLAAVGPSTAAAMRDAFREPDFVPEESVGEAIAEGMGDVQGQRILLLRADIARKELPTILRGRGGEVEDVAAYRIVRPTADATLPDRCPDTITLTSSSAVYGTRDALAVQGKGEWMRDAKLACIGPITAATVRDLGYEVGVMAEEYTIPGLVAALLVRDALPDLHSNPSSLPDDAVRTIDTPSPTVPPRTSASLQGEPSPEEGLLA